MIFFMMTNKKQQYYPLCFFSWRPIKNNSVTPYGFLHDDQRKTTVLPLIFHLIKTTVLPLMFHLIKTTVSLCFFSWRLIKNDSYLIFYLTKTTVLPLMFFFMTTNKKQQCYPLCFFSWRPIKNNGVTPYVFFHEDQ